MVELQTIDWVFYGIINLAWIIWGIYYRPKEKARNKYNFEKEEWEIEKDEEGYEILYPIKKTFELVFGSLLFFLPANIYYTSLKVFSIAESLELGVSTAIYHIFFGIIAYPTVWLGIWLGYKIGLRTGKIAVVLKPINHVTEKETIKKRNKETNKIETIETGRIRIVENAETSEAKKRLSLEILSIFVKEGQICECVSNIRDRLNGKFVKWIMKDERIIEHLKGESTIFGDNYDCFFVIAPYIERYVDTIDKGQIYKKIVAWKDDGENIALFNIGLIDEYLQIHGFNISEKNRQLAEDKTILTNKLYEWEMSFPDKVRTFAAKRLLAWLISLGILADMVAVDEEISEEEYQQDVIDYYQTKQIEETGLPLMDVLEEEK